MTNQDEKRTDYGLVKIHKNVIAQVASLAAKEVEGVSRISSNIFIEGLKFFLKGKVKRFDKKRGFNATG